MTKQSRIGVRLSEKTREFLMEYAQKDGRSLSNLVTKILDDWVKETGKEAEIPSEKVKKGA